jgi:hypothetical protein
MLSNVALKLNYLPGQHFSARIALNYGFKKWLQLNIQICGIYTSAKEGTTMKEG